MLTPEGQAWLTELALEALRPAFIRVLGTEGESVDAQLNDGFPKVEEGEVVLQATFGGDAGIFTWEKTQVVLEDRVIDVNEGELGTKVAKSEWTVEPRVAVAALAPSED